MNNLERIKETTFTVVQAIYEEHKRDLCKDEKYSAFFTNFYYMIDRDNKYHGIALLILPIRTRLDIETMTVYCCITNEDGSFSLYDYITSTEEIIRKVEKWDEITTINDPEWNKQIDRFIRSNAEDLESVKYFHNKLIDKLIETVESCHSSGEHTNLFTAHTGIMSVQELFCIVHHFTTEEDYVHSNYFLCHYAASKARLDVEHPGVCEKYCPVNWKQIKSRVPGVHPCAITNMDDIKNLRNIEFVNPEEVEGE